MRQVAEAFHPEFALRDWRGTGAFVPPSYVRGIPRSLLQALGTLDSHLAHLPLLRALEPDASDQSRLGERIHRCRRFSVRRGCAATPPANACGNHRAWRIARTSHNAVAGQ